MNILKNFKKGMESEVAWCGSFMWAGVVAFACMIVLALLLLPLAMLVDARRPVITLPSITPKCVPIYYIHPTCGQPSTLRGDK